MSHSSFKVTLFSSPRGQAVKRGLIVLGAVMLVLGLISPDSDSSTEADQQESPQLIEDPVQETTSNTVVAAIAHPSVPEGGQETREESRSADTRDVPDSPSSISGYQSAVLVAQEFTGAYAEFSADMSAQEWVDGLAHASDEVRQDLLDGANDSWPVLEDRQVSVSATG